MYGGGTIEGIGEMISRQNLQNIPTFTRYGAWLLSALPLLLSLAPKAWAEDAKVDCPSSFPPPPQVLRSKVYDDVPFKPGEEAKYELRYSALQTKVGYGFLRVYSPILHPIIVGEKDGKPVEEKRHHMVFQAEGYTGDWYKALFVAHDKVQAISRPWDFGISKFYMKQDEDKPLAKRFKSEKWLDFNQFKCEVEEKTEDKTNNKETIKKFPVMHGAVDALGAVFKLRTLNYELGKEQRFLVYTSEKNWWLEVHPIAFESVTVSAGTFDTVKLSLKTYLGKDLQAKGDVFVWIATKHPSRPLVKIEGEVTFGSVYLLLENYTPGK